MTSFVPPQRDYFGPAVAKGIGEFEKRYDPDRLRQLGAEVDESGDVRIVALARTLHVAREPFAMTVLPEGKPVRNAWQVLALEYLCADPPSEPSRFVSFADFPDARSYLPAFDGRVTGRLARTVGADEARFVEASEACGGSRGGSSPLAYLFRLFPLFEVQIVRYEADEDFPAACTVLFADNATSILSPESLAVAGEALARALEGKPPFD